MLSRYRGKTTCPTCEGKRLRPETEYVKIDGHNIQSLVEIPFRWIVTIDEKLETQPTRCGNRQKINLWNQYSFRILNKVGLGYLTLNRTSNTLSGGWIAGELISPLLSEVLW